MEPVIPPHQRAKGELAERPYDKWLYRERHLIEFYQQNQAFSPRLFPFR
jgi:hypothetical protein